ncbi:exopolysaccharide Pel transporter PelG [Paenibacillus sp. 32O-W]|uniref:exopolysaccharide Pel transporter PelG n=1 Tax=Paenibacillus sp. 32O-W TaxID=1695218 RepID=UPI0009EAE07F|nr:exopolysaccharide Pel transporter PelG [Paenibacillus sp. 32O-W]
MMAGIGFELKKLFREQGLLGGMKAYGYSSLTSIGPMALCVAMILALQQLLAAGGAPYAERELFLATVAYCFIFSVLITGGLSMVLTRFVADAMFAKKYELLLPSFYGSAAVCLPLCAWSAWLFLRGVPAGFGYKAAAFLLLAELIVIWLQTVFLSALKDYKRIARHFLYGTAIAVGGSWLVLRFTSYKSATVALAMMDAGFLAMLLLSARHIGQMFPRGSSLLYFRFLNYFRQYPSLFWIGTFLYAGVYVHSFVYWFGPESVRVAERFAISPFYDLPAFYAYLTVAPALVTFVVSLETSFYEKYRAYYSSILNGGTYADIAQARRDMQKTLMHEISFMMEVQLLFTILSIALGIKLLPGIGFSMEQLDTFHLLVLGYFLFIAAFIVMLLMLYFDDRKGALAVSGLFVVLNAAFTTWTMSADQHGLGMFAASFLALVLALARLLRYVRNIDYYTYCSQPPKFRGGAHGHKSRLSVFRKKPGKHAASAVLLLVLAFLLASCANDSGFSDRAGLTAAATQPGGTAATDEAESSAAFREDKRLYERDDDTSVIPLYITILPDQAETGKTLDWYTLNRIESEMEEGDLNIMMQEGASDGSGPAEGRFGYGETEANAKISIRGNTARYAPQRSYKIRLNKQAGLWRDQRTLNLNKHYDDPSRIRNKLSYDIFETLPDIASLRTQFVHLYVKDLTDKNGAAAGFADYGLYTHVEQPNKMFLKNHWLDPNGQLYKAVMFEFFRYPESLKSQSDPDYDKAAFEQVLEIEGREDHDKLLAMLDDVNDMSIPIRDVIDRHFDLDNYLTWLAANILMDNMDTDAQNYLLYSPLNSDKWYFVPWDYDGGWELQRGLHSISDYANGISNYWGNALHRRFLRSEENVRLLQHKIDELYRTAINNEAVAERLEAYRQVVQPFIGRSPDRDFWPIRTGQLDDEFKRIAETPKRSLQRFAEDLQKPKPIFLGDVRQDGDGRLTFFWDLSYDLQGDDLYYDWSVAADPAFTRIVASRKGLTETQTSLPALQPGTYYWKVVVRDKAGHTQIAFDQYEDEEGNPYYGIRQIKVE